MRWPLALIVACGGIALLSPAGQFWLLALVLTCAPGYLLEGLFKLQLPLLARPAVWVGLSLVCTPLLYLWVTAAGLHVRPLLLWIICLVLIGAVLWRWWQHPPWPVHIPRDQGLAPSLLLLAGAVILLTISTRITQLRDVAAPLWVDSIHHALIIRVVAENGQVPYSLRPYMAIDSFIYHWGYHSIAATLVQLTGLSITTVMLWLGQLLEVLIVITVGGSAVVLWRKPLAFVVATIIVAFLSIMPAYYISWGRYTLLAALTILPAVFVISWHGLQTHQQWMWPLALLLAGLIVVHIVVGTAAILWCIAIWLVHLADHPRRWRTFTLFWGAGGIALLLTSSWLAVLIQRTTHATGGPTALEGRSSYNTYAQAAGLYWTANNRQLMTIAVLALLVVLWKRWRAGAVLCVWVALLTLLANPGLVGLPYLSFFNNNIIALAIFVPFSLAIAGGAVALDDTVTSWLLRRQPLHSTAVAKQRIAVRSWWALRVLLLLIFALWTSDASTHLANTSLAIAHSDDLQAMDWIANNTASDARFAINTDGWLYDVSRGTDGGWWILPITGRAVSTPPVIFTFGQPEYTNQVVAQTKWLREATERTPAELASWMQANGYTYAYATPTGRIFSVAKLSQSPLFTERFHNASVSIFELTSAVNRPEPQK